MRLPLGKAVAIPMLIFAFLMIWFPLTDTFTKGKSRIARATASINMGVKVIFSPSFFSNVLFTLSRHCTTLVTSASINEVTCGEVCLLITI